MKKLIIKSIFVVCLMFLPMLTTQLFAQPQPPTIPGTGHGQTGDQGAPLDGGLTILVLMAAAYGGGKAHALRKKYKKDK